MEIPKIITHKNIEPLLDAIAREEYFQPGSTKVPRPEWVNQEVILEVPLGELTRGCLETLALAGTRQVELLPLKGDERFDAQGLEGKARVRKDLFMALMNLRDILPAYRGRIITGKLPPVEGDTIYPSDVLKQCLREGK